MGALISFALVKSWNHFSRKSLLRSSSQPSTAKSKSKYCSVFNCVFHEAQKVSECWSSVSGWCESNQECLTVDFLQRGHVLRTPSRCLLIQQWKLFIKICLTPWLLPVLWGNQKCGAKGLSATCWNGLMYLNCNEWSLGGKAACWCTGKEYLFVYNLSLQTPCGFIPGLKKWLTSGFNVQHATVGWVEKLRLLSAGTPVIFIPCTGSSLQCMESDSCHMGKPMLIPCLVALDCNSQWHLLAIILCILMANVLSNYLWADCSWDVVD